VSGAKRQRRPEILKPGLKQQTPAEKQKTQATLLSDRKRWEYLFSLNVWKPIK